MSLRRNTERPLFFSGRERISQPRNSADKKGRFHPPSFFISAEGGTPNPPIDSGVVPYHQIGLGVAIVGSTPNHPLGSGVNT